MKNKSWFHISSFYTVRLHPSFTLRCIDIVSKIAVSLNSGLHLILNLWKGNKGVRNEAFDYEDERTYNGSRPIQLPLYEKRNAEENKEVLRLKLLSFLSNCTLKAYELQWLEFQLKPEDENIDVPQRGTWSNPIEFLLSSISMSVGLGNIWRFPFTAVSPKKMNTAINCQSFSNNFFLFSTKTAEEHFWFLILLFLFLSANPYIFSKWFSANLVAMDQLKCGP